MAEIVARVARFYSWTWDATMGMYWRAFFAYAKQVTRLQAEEDLRALYLLRAAQAEEKGFKRMVGDLRKQMGQDVTERRDRGKSLADQLLQETKGQRIVGDMVKVIELGSLAAELEEKRRKFGGPHARSR